MVGHKHDLNLTPYSDIYGLIKFIRYISGEWDKNRIFKI